MFMLIYKYTCFFSVQNIYSPTVEMSDFLNINNNLQMSL